MVFLLQINSILWFLMEKLKLKQILQPPIIASVSCPPKLDSVQDYFTVQ